MKITINYHYKAIEYKVQKKTLNQVRSVLPYDNDKGSKSTAISLPRNDLSYFTDEAREEAVPSGW